MSRYLITNRGKLIIGEALNHNALLVKCGMALEDVVAGGECYRLEDTVYLCESGKATAKYLQYVVDNIGAWDTAGRDLSGVVNFII